MAERAGHKAIGHRALGDNAPWRRRSLTIPPTSWQDWMHLAAWGSWMGALICGFIVVGAIMIMTAPDRIITAEDLSGCYASPPLQRPCERILYRTGAMNAAFSGLFGVMSLVIGVWLLWELWSATAPRPITDDFLKLLNDSFARNWRDPRTWPWSRIFYAYTFAAIGFALTAIFGLGVQSVLQDIRPHKPAVLKIDTSQEFRAAPQ
jgi:hypothetical protein